MRILILSLACVTLAGCASGLNCYERVALAKISVPATAETAANAAESGLISRGAAREILTITDSANVTVDQASQLCVLDEKTASNYLDTVSASLDRVSKIIAKEQQP